jgi:hypothetical protein
MKRFWVIATLCLALATPLIAQTTSDTPATREEVEHYMQVMHSCELNQQMLVAMTKPLHQMVGDIYAKDRDNLPSDFEPRMNQFLDDMLHEFSFDKVQEKPIPLYQKHFTAEDLNALAAFYSTPTGQKVLKEMPSLMADSMQITMPIMREQIDRMSRRMQDQIAQMKESTRPGKTHPVIEN